MARMGLVTMLPDWLLHPGPVRLPSGREVLLGEQEESWVTIELGGGVRVTIDDDDDGTVHVELHRGRAALDGPVATRPYGSEVTVRYHAGDDLLEIAELPETAHTRDCFGCPLQREAAWGGWFNPLALLSLLDALASMPVNIDVWHLSPEGGATVWRGRMDDDGLALIEALPDDEAAWSRPGGLSVVARVPVPLWRRT